MERGARSSARAPRRSGQAAVCWTLWPGGVAGGI